MVMANMLYTRKGDKGDTYFFGSEKRDSKASCQTEALGALDEINTLLGICRAKVKGTSTKKSGTSISDILEQVQQDLFIIQAAIAGADKKITPEKIAYLERIVDGIERELPPIKTFFLPGGTELSALLDNARAVSRRVERRVIQHHEENGGVSPEILQYLNRLSSLLYALVRIVNHRANVVEIPPRY